jgi:hypothetical protein
MKKNPDFIIIPHQLILDENLQPLDRILYGVIYWLVHLKGEKCTASNSTLKELCGSKNKLTIANSLNRLEKNGYILRRFFNEDKKQRDEIIPLITFRGVSLNDDRVSSNNDRGVSSNNEQNNKSIKEENINNKNNIAEVVNYFFSLKGWDNKDKDFYSKNKIVYSRYVKPAKQLLQLCDSSLDEAKICLQKVAEWAKSRNLDWGIETVFKKWYEIDSLSPKEKKPYYKGKRIFQRVEGGRWYVVGSDGNIKELGILPKKEEIEWR